MPQPQRFNFAVLLMALPVLAVALLVYQRHSGQEASAPTESSTPLSSAPPSFSGGSYSPRSWPYSAAQRIILKQARTKPRTLPMSIVAVGGSIASVNTAYILANGFDGNGFAYFQSRDTTQYFQWSTINLCWCLRSSLIKDSMNAMPSAEYYSNAKQSFAKGPAGRYGLGGAGIVRSGTNPPTVEVAGIDRHSN